MRNASDVNFGIILAMASTMPLKISTFATILRMRNPKVQERIHHVYMC